MTDKEILEYAIAAYEKAAAEEWDLNRLIEEKMAIGICFFLKEKLNVPYEETARIIRLGELIKLCIYPYKLTNPLDGIIYRRDYLKNLLQK